MDMIINKAKNAVKEYLKGETQIEEVVFCLYTSEDFEVFEKELS